jgi:GcrA cell cycle regulator
VAFEGWTDEAVALLRRRWAERATDKTVSAETIAAELGITRNAVLGKVNRLGMSEPKPAEPSRPRALRLPREPARPALLHVNGSKAPVRAPAKAPEIPLWPSPPALPFLEEAATAPALTGPWTPIAAEDLAPSGPPPDGISLVELTDKTCRWPLGDPADWENFRFCGAEPQQGSVYCGEHHARAFVAIAKRARLAPRK